MAGGSFSAGFMGTAAGISSTGFIAGAATGAAAGLASGLVTGMGNSWVNGEKFGNGFKKGLKEGGIGALMGGITGGFFGGMDALDKGVDFWTGKGTFDMNGAMACKGCNPGGDINSLKKVSGCRYVGTFEGQNVYETTRLGTYSPLGGYSGFTLPDQGIFVGKGVFTRGGINGLAMMQHEFGHVLQYRIVGSRIYYRTIAKESILNCGADKLFGTKTHDTFWTETWANNLSKQYFGTKWLGCEVYTKETALRYYPSYGCDTLWGIIRCGVSHLITPVLF